MTGFSRRMASRFPSPRGRCAWGGRGGGDQARDLGQAADIRGLGAVEAVRNPHRMVGEPAGMPFSVGVDCFARGRVDQRERVGSVLAALQPKPITLDEAGCGVVFGDHSEVQDFRSAAAGKGLEEELPAEDFGLGAFEGFGRQQQAPSPVSVDPCGNPRRFHGSGEEGDPFGLLDLAKGRHQVGVGV